jgi:hypothetical protein
LPALQPAAGNVYYRHYSSVRLGLKTLRGPDALAIVRVTTTWVAAPRRSKDRRQDCGDNFLDFAVTLSPSSNDAI